MTVSMRHFFFLSLLATAACSDNSLLPAYDLSGNTMGTTFNITLVAPPANADLDALQNNIHKKLDHVESIASTYRPESEISEFNLNPSTDWIEVTPEFCDMISAALEISVATHGAFDITVGPLVNLWGFGPSDMENELPVEEEISAVRSSVGYEMLQTNCDEAVLKKASATSYVDLSGWAKGYAVDEIAALLDAGGVENYLVEIGGELRLKGHNAEQRRFSIAIEKPLNNNDLQYTTLQLTDVAVATSGDYRNFYEHDGRRYSHTVDPRTGRPVAHELTGVTVVSTSAAYADAMATALMVLGPQDGHALAEELGIAGYFLIRTDSGIEEKSTSKYEELKHL